MNPQDPQENHPIEPKGGETPRKLPEFIIIEEGPHRGRPPFSQTIQEPAKLARVPLKIRFLCLLIGCISLLWTIGAFVGLAFTALVATLCFFQVQMLNDLLKDFWKYVRGGSAISTGLFIALFSPYLGFVLIITYFFMQDPAWQRGALASLVRSQFNDYISQ